MSDWEETVGNFTTLNTPGMKKCITTHFYHSIVKRKDDLTAASNKDDDPHYMCATLHMELNPKKKDDPEKYTYIGDKTTGTGDKKVVLKKQQLPMKKFANITGDVKSGLMFLTNKFVKECHACYVAKKNTFVDEAHVLEQICEYSENELSMPISSVIVKSSNIFDIEGLIEGNYANCFQKMVEKLRGYFKNAQDKVPEKQLTTIVDAFIKFTKIIAVLMTDILYEKRQAVNTTFFIGILRQINTLLHQNNCHLDDELFDTMKEYIEAHRPPKKESNGKSKGKKKNSEEGEDDEEENFDDMQSDDENNEEDEEAKTKTKSAKNSEKKPRGRPAKQDKSEKKKSTPKTKKDDSDNEENGDGVDVALENLDDEDEWNNDAGY
jgi:hypothetical protein